MSQLWYAEKAGFRGYEVSAIRSSFKRRSFRWLRRRCGAETLRRAPLSKSNLAVSIRSGPHLLAPNVQSASSRLGRAIRRGTSRTRGAGDQMHFDFDRLICGAQCALFLALDGRRKASIDLLTEVGLLAETVHLEGLFRVRYVSLALLLCVVAEVVNERATCANRLIRKIGSDSPDPVILLAARTADENLLRLMAACGCARKF